MGFFNEFLKLNKIKMGLTIFIFLYCFFSLFLTWLSCYGCTYTFDPIAVFFAAPAIILFLTVGVAMGHLGLLSNVIALFVYVLFIFLLSLFYIYLISCLIFNVYGILTNKKNNAAKSSPRKAHPAQRHS